MKKWEYKVVEVGYRDVEIILQENEERVLVFFLEGVYGRKKFIFKREKEFRDERPGKP